MYINPDLLTKSSDFLSYYFYSDNDTEEPPDVYNLFQFYDKFLFNDVMQAAQLRWSNKMTLCAGTCSYQGLNSCTITLSKPLLQFRNNNELKETLLHEMIHGYLFLTNPQACKADGGHGPEFKEIMNKLNEITKLKITVFHQFHDEVELFRKHIWKCNGPCSKNPPYFGICKRAMNRGQVFQLILFI